MKTAGYRKLAAILVIATTGLAGAACSKDKSGDTATGSGSSSVLLDKNTKVTISVDCEPPTTKAAQRKEWLDDIAAFNKAVFDNLKHGGVFIVLDHAAPGTGLADTDTLHRIHPAVVKKEVTAAGFKFVGESKVLRNPADDHSKPVFDKSIRGKTDQFVYKFKKP